MNIKKFIKNSSLIIATTSIVLFSFFENNIYIIEGKRYEANAAEKQEFIDSIASTAQLEMAESGIYASFLIAQAALESGWGGQDDAAAAGINNILGVKRGHANDTCSTPGEIYTESSSNSSTWGGKSKCLAASEGGYAYFRIYDSRSQAIQDHNQKFWCMSRYADILKATTAEGQVRAVALAGYADPEHYPPGTLNEGYYNKLLSVINANDLTKYDAGIKYDGGKPDYASNCGNSATPNEGNEEGFVGQEEEHIELTEDYKYLNFDSEYTGDINEGYIYTKYSPLPMWNEMAYKTDEEKVLYVIGNIFLQGEDLYGDGKLHMGADVINGTETDAPITSGGMISGNFSGLPLPSISCYTSGFGYRGNIGVAGASTYHNGIDFGAPTGTQIFTVGDGTVTHAGSYGTGGQAVVIDHGNGRVTKYMHMSKILVSKGATVASGQVIGLVGSTGASSGPHLHFQIELNGTPVDPLKNMSELSGIGSC